MRNAQKLLIIFNRLSDFRTTFVAWCRLVLSVVRPADFRNRNFFSKSQMKTSHIFQLFLSNGFHLLGNSYGGVEDVVVTRAQLLQKEEFMEVVILTQAFPGVFVLNFSAYLGWRLAGLRGSLAALAGTMLPAFVAVLLLAIIVHSWDSVDWVSRFLRGLRPAVVALLVYPCYKLGRDSGLKLSNVALPVGAALAIWMFHVSPAYIVLAVAILGYVYGRFVRPFE